VRYWWAFAALVVWSADWLIFVFLYPPVSLWVLMRLPAVTAALLLGVYAAAVFPAVAR
jgi:hypothetical protein